MHHLVLVPEGEPWRKNFTYFVVNSFYCAGEEMVANILKGTPFCGFGDSYVSTSMGFLLCRRRCGPSTTELHGVLPVLFMDVAPYMAPVAQLLT